MSVNITLSFSNYDLIYGTFLDYFFISLVIFLTFCATLDYTLSRACYSRQPPIK